MCKKLELRHYVLISLALMIFIVAYQAVSIMRHNARFDLYPFIVCRAPADIDFFETNVQAHDVIFNRDRNAIEYTITNTSSTLYHIGHMMRTYKLIGLEWFAFTYREYIHVTLPIMSWVPSNASINYGFILSAFFDDHVLPSGVYLFVQPLFRNGGLSIDTDNPLWLYIVVEI